eukprot:354863-Chlamydomonas_euryale.AAC.1
MRPGGGVRAEARAVELPPRRVVSRQGCPGADGVGLPACLPACLPVSQLGPDCRLPRLFSCAPTTSAIPPPPPMGPHRRRHAHAGGRRRRSRAAQSRRCCQLCPPPDRSLVYLSRRRGRP